MITEFHAAVRRFIVENFLLGDDADLTNSQSLLQTGVIDSTGVLELVMFIEQEYGIAVADDEMLPENLDSIANISDFIGRKLEARASSVLKTT